MSLTRQPVRQRPNAAEAKVSAALHRPEADADPYPLGRTSRMVVPPAAPSDAPGQLRHLADAARQGKTTIQVVPYRAGAHAATTGPFVILDYAEVTDPASLLRGLDTLARWAMCVGNATTIRENARNREPKCPTEQPPTNWTI